MAPRLLSALSTMTREARHEDERWMRLALRAARRGTPAPNPHVGAVIVHEGELVAVGHHERAGQAHAEIAAMRAAGRVPRGATLYVTLEPCNHHGRTPPCTDAILREGFARVVVGTRYPNHAVRGGGAERLRAAGVEVVLGVLEDEAYALIAPWVTSLELHDEALKIPAE